ncbi:type IV pilus assembly protein PilM [Candidatus Microgenomates bacterium]|nr:type IV pilus assembly protein PilM [Candidatus Microgenomates bacterium]
MATQLFGLDIGSTSIKVVQLTKDSKGAKIASVGYCPAPAKGIDSEAENDQVALASTIKKLVHDAKITTKLVNTALPESQIYTQVREMTPLSDSELSSAIVWEAEQTIPLPLSDVSLSFQVLERPTKPTPGAKMSVLLVAAPIRLVNKYIKVLEMAGFTPISLETEVIAVWRSLFWGRQTSPPTLIINLGALTTDVIIVRNGIINLTRSISTGGKALARAIASKLGLEEQVAEEYKVAYGFKESELAGKVADAIRVIFDVVLEEIKRVCAFYNQKYTNEPLKQVIIVGGIAKLPGLAIYLAESLGLEVQLGNPWGMIQKDEKLLSAIGGADGPVFTPAVGLALKEL